MSRKKVVCMVLTFVMVIAFSSGCVQNADGETSVDTKINGEVGDTGGLTLPFTSTPVEITILTYVEFPDRTNSFAIQELSRRTGLNIKIMETPLAGLNEKAKVLIASGNLPDIMHTSMTMQEVNDLGRQGAFAPINMYINSLPNFKNTFVDNQENDWFLKSGAAADQNLYIWPRYDSVRPVNHGFMYRKDVFDKHGIEEWTNKEEFYQALKALKEIYPDSIPYASKNREGVFGNWGTSWGLNAPNPYYDENDGRWKLSTTDPKYKEMLDFMKKLYNEKLLDPEFLTSTQADWITKMTQPEMAFVTFDWIGRMDSFYEMVRESNPSYDLRYANPIGPTGKIFTTNKVDIGTGVSVANGKNAEFALKLLDYMLSPSGAELMTLGVEGMTYELDSDEKVKYLGFPEDKHISITDLQEKHGMFVPGVYTRMDKRSIYFNYTEKELEAQEKMINENRFAPLDPLLSFSNEDQAYVSEILPKLITEANEFSANYILNASYGDGDWQKWLQAAKAFGEDELIEIYNNTQAEFDKP